MKELIEMGTISSRGQIAVPASMRKELDLEEGQKVLFLMEEDMIIIKKVIPQTFSRLTEPLRTAKKKIKEDEVTALVHKMRESRQSE